jgi:hypothetical protein
MTTASVFELLPHVEQAVRRLSLAIGVGFGWKETRGVVREIPAFRVYVPRKLPLSALSSCERIPAQLEGIATDVIAAPGASPATGAGALASSRTASWFGPERVKSPGALLSNLRGAAASEAASGLGTLGFFALVNRVRTRRELVLVSNRHVLLAHGAQRGDFIYCAELAERDGRRLALATASDPFAELVDEGCEGNRPYRYPREATQEYFVDCASARVLSGWRAQAGGVRGVGRLHPLDVLGGRAPRVRKLGRNGIRSGRVVDVAAPVQIAGGARRTNNLLIRGLDGPFVEPGDSGALVLDDRDHAIGLVWGRSDAGPDAGYASHIHPILEQLDVTLMTGEAP